MASHLCRSMEDFRFRYQRELLHQDLSAARTFGLPPAANLAAAAPGPAGRGRAGRGRSAAAVLRAESAGAGGGGVEGGRWHGGAWACGGLGGVSWAKKIGTKILKT